MQSKRAPSATINRGAMLHSAAVERRVCFINAPYEKKWIAQPLSGLGLRLAEEERDQARDEMQNLLIAQLKLECQFQHGKSLVYAGSAANWLIVGFGGYEEPLAVCERILCHLTA
jgi:hypothetical protein